MPRPDDDELDRALDALAALEGQSRQEIIRRTVLARYKRSRHRAPVDDSVRRMRARWDDLIDDLGSA